MNLDPNIQLNTNEIINRVKCIKNLNDQIYEVLGISTNNEEWLDSLKMMHKISIQTLLHVDFILKLMQLHVQTIQGSVESYKLYQVLYKIYDRLEMIDRERKSRRMQKAMCICEEPTTPIW